MVKLNEWYYIVEIPNKETYDFIKSIVLKFKGKCSEFSKLYNYIKIGTMPDRTITACCYVNLLSDDINHEILSLDNFYNKIKWLYDELNKKELPEYFIDGTRVFFMTDENSTKVRYISYDNYIFTLDDIKYIHDIVAPKMKLTNGLSVLLPQVKIGCKTITRQQCLAIMEAIEKYES